MSNQESTFWLIMPNSISYSNCTQRVCECNRDRALWNSCCVELLLCTPNMSRNILSGVCSPHGVCLPLITAVTCITSCWWCCLTLSNINNIRYTLGHEHSLLTKYKFYTILTTLCTCCVVFVGLFLGVVEPMLSSLTRKGYGTVITCQVSEGTRPEAGVQASSHISLSWVHRKV